MNFLARKYFEPYKKIPKVVWFLLGSVFVNRVGSVVPLFLSIYFHSFLKFSLSTIGFIFTAYGIGCVLGSFAGGVCCDHFKPKYILILSFILMALLLLVISISYAASILSILFSCYGLFTAICQPANNLILSEYSSPENRLNIFSIYRVMQCAGISVAGIAGGVLSAVNFKVIFYVNSIALFIAAASIFFVSFKMKRIADARVHVNENKQIAPVKEILANKKFFFLWFLVLSSLIMLYQVNSTYSPYLYEKYHLTLKQIGILFSINAITIILSEVPLLDHLSKYKLSNIAVVGVILIGLGFYTLTLGQGMLWATISCVILTFGEILTFPTSQSLALDLVNGRREGRYMGLYYSSLSVANIFAPLLGFRIYDHLGGNALWISCLFFSIIISIGYYRLGR